MGDPRGLRVLDAGCGEGDVSRRLLDASALVTGVDISPRLLAKAKSNLGADRIEYRLADLREPLQGLDDAFDLAVANFVLNDMSDHQAYFRTVSRSLKVGGRFVLSFNSPSADVVVGKLDDYFARNHADVYPGLSSVGIRTYYFHRTLGE